MVYIYYSTLECLSVHQHSNFFRQSTKAAYLAKVSIVSSYSFQARFFGGLGFTYRRRIRRRRTGWGHICQYRNNLGLVREHKVASEEGQGGEHIGFKDEGYEPPKKSNPECGSSVLGEEHLIFLHSSSLSLAPPPPTAPPRYLPLLDLRLRW